MDGGFLFHIEENFIKIWQKIDELMKHNKDTEMRKERTYTTDINTFHNQHQLHTKLIIFVKCFTLY